MYTCTRGKKSMKVHCTMEKRPAVTSRTKLSSSLLTPCSPANAAGDAWGERYTMSRCNV